MNKVVASDFLIAIDFGTNSPKTMCIIVISKKLQTTEMVVTVAAASSILKEWNVVSMMWCRALSPTQPKAREASVIPNCVAES